MKLTLKEIRYKRAPLPMSCAIKAVGQVVIQKSAPFNAKCNLMQNFRKLAQLEIPKKRGELRARCRASDKDLPYYHYPYYYHEKKFGLKIVNLTK